VWSMKLLMKGVTSQTYDGHLSFYKGAKRTHCFLNQVNEEMCIVHNHTAEEKGFHVVAFFGGSELADCVYVLQGGSTNVHGHW